MLLYAMRQERKQAERGGRRGGAGERRPAPAAPSEAPGMRQKDAVLAQVRAFQRLHPDDRHALLTEKARCLFRLSLTSADMAPCYASPAALSRLCSPVLLGWLLRWVLLPW
jgi:hypothetical protein